MPAIGHLHTDKTVPGPDRDRDRPARSARPAVPDTIAEQLAHQQGGVIPARVPGTEHPDCERAGDPRPLRPPGHRHALPDLPPSHQRTRLPRPPRPGHHRGRQAGVRMHARLSRTRQTETCHQPGPSVAVRGKPTVHTDRPGGRTPSAYLHRRGDASGSVVAAFTVCGRTSLCSLALIAAGVCERAAGSGGAKCPRSGAEGALDTAARERIMAGGGKGANLRRDWRFRVCWRGAFLAGIGVTCSMTGRGRRGTTRLT